MFPRSAGWLLGFVVLSATHLLVGHALVRGTYGRFVRLILYPLFVAARGSTRLTRLIHSHGGWPAAVFESTLDAAFMLLAASATSRLVRASK